MSADSAPSPPPQARRVGHSRSRQGTAGAGAADRPRWPRSCPPLPCGRALVLAGVELTAVVPAQWSEGGAEQVLSPEPYEVVELPVLRSGDINRHRYEDAAAQRQVLDRVQPDLIDLHEEPFAVVTRQWLGVVPAAVPVVSYTAQNIDKRWPPPFAQWETAALRRLAGVYPCSRQAASVVRGKGYGGLLEVLPFDVDATTMHAANRRIGCSHLTAIERLHLLAACRTP